MSADTTFTALTDATLEGWESIVFTPKQTSVEIGFDPRSYMAFVRENVPTPETLPQYDFDHDGLPDRWELANGLDPFTPGETSLDPDKDGLTTIDEYEFNTNPKSDDTDGDGQKDFGEANRSLDLDPDYLAIRLQTRDTGKVNNGQNCAVCHTTQLKVGEFSHYTKSSDRTTQAPFSEMTFYFRKGTNYPIQLTELAQNLSQAPPNGNNPTTTAAYNANILAATNQPRAFVVQDPQNKLGTNKPWSSFPTDPSVSVGTLIVPKIEVTWEAAVGSPPLETNSNAGGGVRMFPDALSPTASGFRNTVIVNVKTTPALPNQLVRLKSFDVDDPSGSTGGIVDTNDHFGFFAGNDNRGTPKAGQLSQATLTLDTQGKAFAVLTVPTKPGDNLRVAAVMETPGAQAHLDALQVAVEPDDLYVTADTNSVLGFAGGISPMLTVWRKLHLELDSMDAPPPTGSEALFESATILQVRPNRPSAGQSMVKLRWPEISGGGLNTHERGKLEVPGVPIFKVIASRAESGPQAPAGTVVGEVMINGVLSTNNVGAIAKLYDDDEQYLKNDLLYPSLLTLPSPPVPADTRSADFVQAMQAAFEVAYIRLVDANGIGWNTQPRIPFKRTAGYGQRFFDVLVSPFDVGNLQLKDKDKPEFWAYSIVFGYQPEHSKDGEPNAEFPLVGQTDKKLAGFGSYGFSVVWMESVRERKFGIGRPGAVSVEAAFTNTGQTNLLRQTYLDDLHGVIAHEIGHSPGSQSESKDHSEKGHMEVGAPYGIKSSSFTEATIRRFRNVTRWTQ